MTWIIVNGDDARISWFDNTVSEGSKLTAINFRLQRICKQAVNGPHVLLYFLICTELANLTILWNGIQSSPRNLATESKLHVNALRVDPVKLQIASCGSWRVRFSNTMTCYFHFDRRLNSNHVLTWLQPNRVQDVYFAWECTPSGSSDVFLHYLLELPL